MAHIFITGSSDGLGQMAAKSLIKDGHKVVLHARNEERGESAMKAAPGASGIIIGDLSSIAETKNVAQEANQLGRFDAVIHNAGLGYREVNKNTSDGLPPVFAVNSIAPYILTALMKRANRLIYVSSGLHRSGDASLKDLEWKTRTWNAFQAYSDTKLHDVLIAFAGARKWPSVYSNALEPGWVATKMGGSGAPDSLEEGPKTQVWLATSDDAKAKVTGKYFFHQKIKDVHPDASKVEIQEKFLEECRRISGVAFPGN